MAHTVPWTRWTPYRWFPWVEWRLIAVELDSCPGVPLDAGLMWVERRWRKA